MYLGRAEATDHARSDPVPRLLAGGVPPSSRGDDGDSRRTSVPAPCWRSGRTGSEYAVTYLTGWPVTRLAALSTQPDPTARCGSSSTTTSRAPGGSPSETDVRDVDERMVGDLLAGGGRYGHPWPGAGIVRWAEANGSPLIPIDAEHARIRMVKSEEEQAALRLGAQASDAGGQALIDACGPGATDWDLLAAARDAYTRLGARDHICYICVTDMSAPGSRRPEPGSRRAGCWPSVRWSRSSSARRCAPEYPGRCCGPSRWVSRRTSTGLCTRWR